MDYKISDKIKPFNLYFVYFLFSFDFVSDTQLKQQQQQEK